jgi:hypothetical protein
MRSACALRAGFSLSEMSPHELWAASLGLGGSMRLDELVATLDLRREPRRAEHDIVAAALNDWFHDHGGLHVVAYSDELDR